MDDKFEPILCSPTVAIVETEKFAEFVIVYISNFSN